MGIHIYVGMQTALQALGECRSCIPLGLWPLHCQRLCNLVSIHCDWYLSITSVRLDQFDLLAMEGAKLHSNESLTAGAQLLHGQQQPRTPEAKA